MLHRNFKKQVQSTVVSIPSKEKKIQCINCKIKYLHNWVILKINLLKKLSNTFIQVNSKKIQKSNIYTARSYLRLTCSKIYF